MSEVKAMSKDDYFEVLVKQWQDEIVVCSLGTTADEWWKRTSSSNSFYVNAAMGFAASFALGIALNCPDQRVWMLDSDGALAMNLGGLLTEASTQPKNLVHLVLNNRSYGCLGGAQLVNAQQSDYVAIARGTGIARSISVATPQALVAALEESAGGHAFIVAEVEGTSPSGGFEPPISVPFDGPEAKYLFGRFMERRLGRSVFGPNGY